MGDMWQICGLILKIEVCRKLQKIDIFLRFSIQTLLKCAKIWDIYRRCGVQKIDIFLQKIAIFSEKVLKIEEISTFWLISRHITGRYAGSTCAQKLQFFSIFEHFTIQFVLERPHFMGHMRPDVKPLGKKVCAKNCNFFQFFEENRSNTGVLSIFCPNHGTYAGHMRIWKCAKNCNFFQIRAHFQYKLYCKVLKTWDICGRCAHM